MEFVSESYGGVKKSVKKTSRELSSSSTGSTEKDAETTIPSSPSGTTTRKITATAAATQAPPSRKLQFKKERKRGSS
jgi:hypothetical protein